MQALLPTKHASTAAMRGCQACAAPLCRGHNGKVRSIVWTPDDAKLVSAGMDGAVYEWRLKDLKREKENVLKARQGVPLGGGECLHVWLCMPWEPWCWSQPA